MKSSIEQSRPDRSRRHLLAAAAIGAAALAMPGIAFGQSSDTIRIGVPTKTYFPTIIVDTAIRQGLFEKEGIKAEMTVYRSGAEGFEAIAAGAADLVYNSTSSVAGGLRKGVNVRSVANGSLGYYGWHLVVKDDSPIQQIADLKGKKVGITSAGSGTDILARWTMQTHDVEFTRVPVGGGGLVPNLLTGNLDAAVLYSPLTYQMLQAGQARSLIDFGAEVPPHSTGSWIATDKMIENRPEVLQKALNAIYGGLAYLRDPANREEVVDYLAKVNEIDKPVAAAELDENLHKLSPDGEFQKDWLVRSLENANLIGMTDLAPVEDIYVTKFKPVPTKP